uniref:Uncharacterized protein n=1 Tax=Anguilla anguilla TaxID=7936 RepID=A0A0E9WCB2_ANGAN
MPCVVSYSPGVSSTVTRLPETTAVASLHSLVLDLAPNFDSNFLSPTMVFPEALFPAPVLPSKTMFTSEGLPGSVPSVLLIPA